LQNLLECIRLRVKDIDFASNLLIVRCGKGEKDRTTTLPDKIKESLESHLQRIKRTHDQDLAKGYEGTTLPDALQKKYPKANKEWAGHNIRTMNWSPKTGQGNKVHFDLP